MSELITTLPTDSTMIPVRDPFSDEVIGSVCSVGPEAADEILARAERGRQTARDMSRHARAAVLDRAANIIEGQQESFARLIVSEAGKTITQARKETMRAVNTLRLSAAEARRNAGEVVPFDSYEGSEGRQGWFTREPIGIVMAITPFNDPLNLVAHKLGPAVAGGNAVILKPSPLTPLSALRLVDTLIEAGLPQDVVTVVNGDASISERLVSDRRVRMISFTGGFATGEAIARTAGLKRLAMDLGGNAPVLVLADADIEDAAASCVSGAFWAAGQNCIGAQRILIAREVYQEFRTAFVAKACDLRAGNPHDPLTDVGPMITRAAAEKAKARIDAAVASGASVLCGSELSGSVLAPTVLENVSHESSVWKEEAFAPYVVLEPFDSLGDAVRLANEIDFSLHAGVFTRDLGAALALVSAIDAGGVMVNDSSDYRFDGMPFGGFKYGSMGREGVRFAYEEMTQPKVVCINEATGAQRLRVWG